LLSDALKRMEIDRINRIDPINPVYFLRRQNVPIDP
jgi:hypothetical protein